MSRQPLVLLALETATSACSVALAVGPEVYHRQQQGNNIHSAVLLEMVQAVLQESGVAVQQLSAVAVGQGPGSFTGLRIGVGVGQGLAYGVACPMIGVSSLDALAQQSGVNGPVIAGIDARMGEIYWCEYTCDFASGQRQFSRNTALQLTIPSAVTAAPGSHPTLVGNAWAAYHDALAPDFIQKCTHFGDSAFPHALAVLQLAKNKYFAKDWVPATDFAPEYVRNNVAKKMGDR